MPKKENIFSQILELRDGFSFFCEKKTNFGSIETVFLKKRRLHAKKNSISRDIENFFKKKRLRLTWGSQFVLDFALILEHFVFFDRLWPAARMGTAAANLPSTSDKSRRSPNLSLLAFGFATAELLNF